MSEKRRTASKLLSLVLALGMLLGLLPTVALAAPDTSDGGNATSANVAKVESYAAQLLDANDDKSDYRTGGFTWDTEGKKDSWRYFNGVMLDAFLMAKTDGSVDFATAFYNGNISVTKDEDGTITDVSINKYGTGELDSVPTALGLFDLLDTANADAYKAAIQYIYTQLENQTSYDQCGGNYLHKQEDDGTPTSSWSEYQIGLDGLYMAQPFLMECANAIEAEKLTLTHNDEEKTAVTAAEIYQAVYDRFVWVADAMYDKETGLYHHGWNVENRTGNDHFWGRGIGWYAVALVDVMEMMPSNYQEQMKPFLTKLFDGMLKYQDSETGMWYNVVNRGTDLSGNRLETSVSAMMAYALMKAYNNGYVSAEYGQAGLKAFNGVVENKMSADGSTVTDIYQKSGVGDSDKYYTRNSYVDDEAKGVGALIMAATQATKAANSLPDPDPGEGEGGDEGDTQEPVKDASTGITVSGTSASDIDVEDKSRDETVQNALSDVLEEGFTAYDITLTGYTEGEEATVTMPAPEGANAVYYVSDDGETVEEISNPRFSTEDDTVTFTTDHFSTFAAGVRVADAGDNDNADNVQESVPDKTKPNWGLSAATSYPEYPDDGAVRIDKTATGQNFNSTGVVEVELDVAGISVKQGVDVVLVVDVSNSMGWTDNWFENMSPSEVEAATDANKIPQNWWGGAADADDTTDKLDQAMAAARQFATILLEGNTEGSESNNSISFVTFAGYDNDNSNEPENSERRDYVDSVQTVFTNIQDAKTAKDVFDNTKFTDYSVRENRTSVDYTLQIGNINGGSSSGINRGNTNYDYAFAEANAAVTELKSEYGGTEGYEETGRETIVVFMTDGAPSHYNDNRLNGSHADTLYGTGNTYAAVGEYANGGVVSADTWLEFISDPNTYAEALNDNIDGFYAVGFDLNHGGFGDYSFSEGDLRPVLENIAGPNTVDVELVSNGAALEAFYRSLANQIMYAGTNAEVTDTINSEFTLQTTQTTGTGDQHGTLSAAPTIEVTSYELYTKADGVADDLIGTRKENGATPLETVTFSEDGTKAYSDLIANSTQNIMDGNGNIDAVYFDYDAATKTFTWDIGDITDDEVVLSYYAYLTGTMEGQREEGTLYYTNESATLEYVDIKGDYAKKDFPMPAVAWGGAVTTWEYYLVNADGQPVNSAGEVVPFANRITLASNSEVINLNDDELVSAEIHATDLLPDGYVLYDPSAYYTVQTASSADLECGLTISDPPSGMVQTTIQVYPDPSKPSQEETYIQTHVAFGVVWNETPQYADFALTKDQIVVDYGKAIQVDVLANDTTIPDGYTGKLVGFTAYNPNANLEQMQQSAGSAPYTTSNGTYTIVEGKANFQLTQMLSQVEKVFCVVEITEPAVTAPEGQTSEGNVYYLYEELDIIPATVMLYETDFADGVFDFKTSGTAWKKVTVSDDIVADGPQDDGTIGQNLYGYDRSYANDKYQSNASSWSVTGAKSNDTTVNFSFRGTGFDIISRTDTDEGFIRVSVYSDAGKTQLEKRVTVLNKSESALLLYQIPVVSIENLPYGTHYVEISVPAAHESTAYPALSHGGQFHFDAIRIYNPINASASASATSDAGIAYAAYMADGEWNASVEEIRNKLLTSTDSDTPEGWIEVTYDEELDTEVEGVVFVDRKRSSVGINDYAAIGPNNEVYLTAGQMIGFMLTVEGELPASIDIGAKSADGDKVTLHTTVYAESTVEGIDAEVNQTISSSTAQYYDLLEGKTAAEVFGEDKTIYVYIENATSGILSITDLKVAYGSTGIGSVRITSNTALVARTAAETTAEMACDVLSAEFTAASVKRNQLATMTVVTEADVERLEVENSSGVKLNATVTETGTDADGNKTWTVSVRATSSGTLKATVTGYTAEGTSGASATDSISIRMR